MTNNGVTTGDSTRDKVVDNRTVDNVRVWGALRIVEKEAVGERDGRKQHRPGQERRIPPLQAL